MQPYASFAIEQLQKRNSAPESDISVVFAPYRVCPLGAHVDHQLGLVSGCGISEGVFMAFTPRTDDQVCLWSTISPSACMFSLSDLPAPKPSCWSNYCVGAAAALATENQLSQGVDMFVYGSVPSGGLGSSAAIGLAYLLVLSNVHDIALSDEELIAADSFIENSYLGLKNGVLDQSMSLLSKRDSLLLIDCKDQSREYIKAPDVQPTFLFVYSGMEKALVHTDFNVRVDECFEASRLIHRHLGRPCAKEPPLGSISYDEYVSVQSMLPDTLRKRADHFFSECTRVQEGADAWRRGDWGEFGTLVSASGKSSQYNFECGADQLVMLRDLMHDIPEVYGARFSGAGFRGSCLALTSLNSVEGLSEAILDPYRKRYPEEGERAQLFLCSPEDGARYL